MARSLKNPLVENYSGNLISTNIIKTIKGHQFRVLEETVGGDAPKDVLRIYQHDGVCRKNKIKSWPTYIVKVGHKRYPNESITEQIFTEIGKELGVKIADSQIFEIEGIIRFCSKHFHKESQILNHGAEILSRFFEQPNEEWIDRLEKDKTIKARINIDDVILAIKQEFKEDSEVLIKEFIDMLLFDCFVGNNDRHYYNWGVLTFISEKQPPYFAPIYDTARGLWWNSSDKAIVELFNSKSRENEIEKYVLSSKPKISTPDNSKCNHFELIKYLKDQEYVSKQQGSFWQDYNNFSRVESVIEKKFQSLMIKERLEIIKKTLLLRFKKTQEILKL